MIEVDRAPRAFRQRGQRDELIVDHLDVRDHVEGREVGRQRSGLVVVVDARQRRVERDPDYTRRRQLGQLRAG